MPRSLVVLTQSALCAALLLSTSPVQAQSLRLIAPDHPNTPLQVEVGEIVRVQVLADFESLDAAGLAAYVTVPQDAFEVLDLGLPGQVGTQPFRLGPLFQRAVLPTNVLLPEIGFAADIPGQQLDLATLHGLGDAGVRGAGVAATFEILALAPIERAVLHIDSTPIRETRVVLADGRSERRFRSTEGLTVTVTAPLVTAVSPRGWARLKRDAER